MSSQPKLKEWETLGWNLPLFSTSTLPQPPSKTNRSWNFCFILSRQIDTTRRIVCPADGGRDSLRPFSLFSPTIWIRGHEDGRPRLAVYANCLRLHYIDELPLRSWRQNEWRPRGGYTHTHTREPTSLVSLSLFPVVTFRSAAGSGSSRLRVVDVSWCCSSSLLFFLFFISASFGYSESWVCAIILSSSLHELNKNKTKEK